MFSWFKKQPSPPPAPPPQARVPDGALVYAVGDIHGRFDLLQRLLGQVEADAAGRKTQLIFLGDYVDRGRDSKQVIDRLLAPFPAFIRPIFLRGNHEEVFLDFLQNTAVGTSWFQFGGRETLMSYGVRFNPALSGEALLQDLQAQLCAKLPPAHRAFLENLPSHHTVGDYHFVHAGVRPGVVLDQQRDSDRLWIRGEFLDYRGVLEKVIVHGHSISEAAEFFPHRIGIDTGAYASGVLTALVLEGAQQRLLQT